MDVAICLHYTVFPYPSAGPIAMWEIVKHLFYRRWKSSGPCNRLVTFSFMDICQLLSMLGCSPPCTAGKGKQDLELYLSPLEVMKAEGSIEGKCSFHLALSVLLGYRQQTRLNRDWQDQGPVGTCRAGMVGSE